LIVEDDVILGWALERALYDAGFGAVKIAASVGEALKHLRYAHPDVVLLDLPLRDGQRSLPIADALDDAEIPFVFLTGYREMVSQRHRRRPYLTKPASAEEVLEALTSAMAPATAGDV